MTSVRHKRIRARQANDAVSVTHPVEKRRQVERIVRGGTVLEVFAGIGQMTRVYESLCCTVTAWDKRLGTGDSWTRLLRGVGVTYDVVDLDPYGFPSRAFPHVFLYIQDGYMFLTFPKPWVQRVNGISREHLRVWWGAESPSHDQILLALQEYGLRYWREVVEEDCLDLGRVWRFALRVKRVKATEYCNVRNRAKVATLQGKLL